MEVVKRLAEKQAILESEIIRLQQQNSELQAQGESRRAVSLIDNRGLGRPPPFDGTEWIRWTRKFESYICSASQGFDLVLEWATMQKDIITGEMVTAIWSNSTEVRGNITRMSSEIYALLMQLVTGEAFDLVANTNRGNGVEAYRKLARKFDPTTGGRQRNLLRAILQPGRASDETLGLAIERWEEQVNRYEKFKDDSGQRPKITDDVKIAAVEGMVPLDLEKHLQLNANRMWSFADVREEVQGYIDAKLTNNFKELAASRGRSKAIPATDKAVPMDIDAVHSSRETKGSGKQKGPKGGCWHCGGPHYGRDCDRKKGSSAESSTDFHGFCSKCGKWGHSGTNCRGKGGKGAKASVIAEVAEEPSQTDDAAEEPDLGCIELLNLESAKSIRVGGNIISAVLDSGAARSVIPPEICSNVPICKVKQPAKFRGATGEIVSELGVRRIFVKPNRCLNFSVTKVTRPLISISQLTKRGHTVDLNSQGGKVSLSDGSQIPIRMEGGLYMIDLPLAARTINGTLLAPMEEVPEATDFRRQVIRP